MIIGFEFISGLSIGLEFAFEEKAIIIDLAIVRVLIFY